MIKKIDKKAVSVMIGYILLISAILATSILVYGWMKTYVPKDIAECPDGVSIYLKELYCDEGKLKFTIKNNGRFDVGGYYIHATVNEEQEIATEDLFQYEYNYQQEANENIEFGEGGNVLEVGSESQLQVFDLGSDTQIFLVEVLPFRYEDGKKVTCTKAKIREVIKCPE